MAPMDYSYRAAGSAPDFAAAHQLQQTGLGALAPAAALDALASVMLAAWHRAAHASPITAARVDWSALCKQVQLNDQHLAPNIAHCCLRCQHSGDDPDDWSSTP